MLHHFRLGQQDIFDGVGGEEAILHIEERSFGIFGGAARDQGEIAGLLRIARVEDAPAAIGHAHNVVMAGMNIESLGGEGAGADVEDHGQSLAGNHVEDLFHEDEALTRCEVGYAPTGDGKTFASGGGAMFGFGFYESQFVTPQVALSVGDLNLVAAAHGGG